jgi:hypothetical protein
VSGNYPRPVPCPQHQQFRLTRTVMGRRLAAIIGAAIVVAAYLTACGGSSSTPQSTLHSYLMAWSHGDWAAMKRQVAGPPPAFTSVNAQAFSALGVRTATFSAGRISQTGNKATARVTERYALPRVGPLTITTTVRLVQRNGRWRVAWTPATITPALHSRERLAIVKDWPTRAAITGAGGAPLVAARTLVTVGVVGSRIKNARAVGADLIAAGAPQAAVAIALTQAKAHPTFFEPVFQVSQARFGQLKAAPGPGNVYAVPGTQFERAMTRGAITPQLAAHLVGTVGAVTSEQLAQLGPPYDASSQVGQTGIEQAYERRLAGTPRTKVVVVSAGGAPTATLAAFPGHQGRAVATSIDPRVQRAAEAALQGVHKHAALVAMRASTGQVLAVVSNPPSVAYNQAFQGAFPPGSTFKVLTSTALIQHGLSPTSPASCPPTITVDGEVFHNAEGDQPATTLDQAFTESCNTAFIGLAAHRLSGADFTSAANVYGLDAHTPPRPGGL